MCHLAIFERSDGSLRHVSAISGLHKDCDGHGDSFGRGRVYPHVGTIWSSFHRGAYRTYVSERAMRYLAPEITVNASHRDRYLRHLGPSDSWMEFNPSETVEPSRMVRECARVQNNSTEVDWGTVDESARLERHWAVSDVLHSIN